MTTNETSPSTKAVSAGLWVVQALLFLLYVATGLWKLVTPITELGATFAWMGELPAAVVRGTGVIDLLGGIGVLLPSLTRVRPSLAVLAAWGCTALQASAIVFHVSRGEAASTPFNFFLVALSVFVAWGRGSRAPISART